ncbi:MAG: ABC transporter permease [Alphaproteobacteria bacterium]
MNKLWVVTKNEFFRYFISPLAYVYLICFLLLNGSFAVYFGHFLERGQADLLPMFSFQPWLYLLFIPGISMRLWAEEFRTKTILQIITMPVSIPALVWGKFFRFLDVLRSRPASDFSFFGLPSTCWAPLTTPSFSSVMSAAFCSPAVCLQFPKPCPPLPKTR